MPSGGKKKDAAKAGFSLIPNEKLIQMYSTMVKYSLLVERAAAISKQPNAASAPNAAAGAEASVVGVAIDLKSGDSVASSSHGVLVDFVRGAMLPKTLRELRSESRHPSPVAEELQSILRKAAVSVVKKNQKIAVVVAGGDRAATEDWQSALRSAEAGKLPIVFVAIEPGEGHGRSRLPEKRAKNANGTKVMPAMAVDMDDPVAVYRVGFEAIVRARAGRGPTLIECVQYRVKSHSKNERTSRRAQKFPASQTPSAPIQNMERYLESKGLFDPAMRQKIAAQFLKELDAAATRLLKD